MACLIKKVNLHQTINLPFSSINSYRAKRLDCFTRIPRISCSYTSLSSSDSLDVSAFQLQLYNHYTRQKELVNVAGSPVCLSSSSQFGEAIKPAIGTVYVCGPTVYDYCHIGHAVAYIRFDIFRRFLQTYSNVNLVTAMGITDIDEKIIVKSVKEGSSYRSVGDKYYSSFLDDLTSLNINSVDIFVRVSDHIDEIIEYVGKLEVQGFAYINPVTNDVNFDTSKVNDFKNKADTVTDKSVGKKSPKDFALWRSAKNEPLWMYVSPVDGSKISGRPGWHIECSVIASWLFGSSLDFHFGGKDLIFPHHLCESACSSAYFNLVNEQPIVNWASHWFHSSHVQIDREKMSKSIGNVISIRDFLHQNSPDILRIMCSYSHYRTDLEYDSLVIKRYSELDRRFKQFALSIKEKTLQFGLYKFQSSKFINCEPDDGVLSRLIQESVNEIISGAADDWNLHKGLNSILEIIKYFDTLDNPTLIDLYCLKNHVFQWMKAIGLSYPNGLNQINSSVAGSTKQDLLLLHLINYRNQVRISSLKGLKTKDLTVDQAKKLFIDTLISSDELRDKVDSLGYVIKDSKFNSD